jgi:Ima1 N-terminal domain
LFISSCRKRFPITVNCWFCSTNTKVPYINQNSFFCPSCKQFNGFDEDGDYNREIPEQHYSKLNASNNLYSHKTELRLQATNGLCEGCNRNQEMKIIQLANFKPRCEAKYDEEIEEYRQKLEDSYQLCQQCQRHLNKTLNRVKTKLIGSRISQLVSKGLQAVNNNSKPLKKDRQILGKLAMFFIFNLSIVNLVRETEINIDFIRRALTNESLTNVYYHLVAFRLTVVDLFGGWMKEFELGKYLDINTDSIATSALVLNFMILLSQQQIRLQIIASMLFWSMKMVLSEVAINPSHIMAVKGTIAGVLVIISLHMIVKSYKVKEPTFDQSGASFRKIHSEIIDDSDNEFDLSESICSFDARSVKSSMYSPSLMNFNSCIRERTLLKPASTFPAVNKTLHNSTLTPFSSHMSNVDSRSVSNFDVMSNRSFSIRQEVSAADRTQVRKDINKLNISGNLLGSTSTLKDFSLNKSLNPFSLENSRCGSPTPSIASVFSGSYRAQVISPPRLEPTYMGEASWVAGGYWSSPQKRCHDVNCFKQTVEMSRSSSQSSGLGTIGSEKNSRENSVGKDEFTSVFSEPVRRRNLFEKPSDTRSLFGQSYAQPPRTNNFFLNTTSNHLSAANNFRKYRDANSTFFNK